MIGAYDALGAYGRASGLGGKFPTPTPKPASGPSGPGEPDFGAILGDMVSGTADAIRGANVASANQVAGKGDLIDMVTAISAAENALDTTIAVRDRIVSAYGEIMRMQI